VVGGMVVGAIVVGAMVVGGLVVGAVVVGAIVVGGLFVPCVTQCRLTCSVASDAITSIATKMMVACFIAPTRKREGDIVSGQ